MAWLKSSWRWMALNLFAAAVALIVMTQGSIDWSATDAYDPGLESGKWAIRFLLICLTMTPLKMYFGWNSALKLRKPAGLWGFGFALLHVLVYLREAQFTWLEVPLQPYLLLGVLGFLILATLAMTSNRLSMRHLKKNWKRLHRLVYVASNLVVLHAILSTSMSKKITVRDPQAVHELKIYLLVLTVLLVVRIPLVRCALVQLPVMLQFHRQADRQVITTLPGVTPDRIWENWPVMYSRDENVLKANTLPETQLEVEGESQQEIDVIRSR